MTASRYPIPAKTVRVEFKVKNSVFISTIGEAQTVEEARAFIDAVKTEFADANHNVYAFKVGYGGSVTEGMTDDGEPSGTAGKPALAVLRGADLGDVVVVVTRYFGGTKLGTGGLVRAYTQGVQDALEALPCAERVDKVSGLIASPYNLYEQIKRLVDAEGGEIIDEDFAADVTLTVSFVVDERENFEAELQTLSAGQIAVLWDE